LVDLSSLTLSGGGLAPTPYRSTTPANGYLASGGIDSWPVTEAIAMANVIRPVSENDQHVAALQSDRREWRAILMRPVR